ILLSCLEAGVCAGKWFGLGGNPLSLWICGAVGVLMLSPLRLFSVGGWLERQLSRGRDEANAHAILIAIPLIGAAVVRRCPLPWYINSDVLFPAAVGGVLVGGWLLV